MLCCRSEGVLFRLAGLSCIVWAREGISVCIREDGEIRTPLGDSDSEKFQLPFRCIECHPACVLC